MISATQQSSDANKLQHSLAVFEDTYFTFFHISKITTFYVF